MRRKIGMLVLVFVAMLLIAGLAGLIFPAKTLRPARPLPNPNGYDTFVRAGLMPPNDVSDFASMSHEELLTLVDANSNAVQIARTGLEQDCRVPLQYSQAYIEAHLPCLSRLKRLARALAAEGRLAEMEKRPADAAKSYLDTIQFGIASCHGGVLIDAMAGVGIEAIGTRNLRGLTNSLDARLCRDIAARLETLDAGRERWQDISDQEHDWVQRTFPGFLNRLAIWFTSASTRRTLDSTQQKFDQQVSRTRRLAIEFSSRAYELEHQQKPASFSDLVPAYLKTIPQDPLTGTNMVLFP